MGTHASLMTDWTLRQGRPKLAYPSLSSSLPAHPVPSRNCPLFGHRVQLTGPGLSPRQGWTTSRSVSEGSFQWSQLRWTCLRESVPVGEAERPARTPAQQPERAKQWSCSTCDKRGKRGRPWSTREVGLTGLTHIWVGQLAELIPQVPRARWRSCLELRCPRSR